MASTRVVQEVNLVEHDEPDSTGNVVRLDATRRNVVAAPASRHDVPFLWRRLKYRLEILASEERLTLIINRLSLKLHYLGLVM